MIGHTLSYDQYTEKMGTGPSNKKNFGTNNSVGLCLTQLMLAQKI